MLLNDLRVALGCERQRHYDRRTGTGVIAAGTDRALSGNLQQRRSALLIASGRRRECVELEPFDRRELPAGNATEIRQLKRSERGRRRSAAVGQEWWFDDSLRHPIEPSICSSIRRFISTAYSIGSSLTIGSMKPLTISLPASSSEMPWLIR